MQLNFKISFSNLYTCSGLIKLDETFLDYIKSCDESLFCSLIEAREKAASSLMSSQCLTLGSIEQPMLATQMTDSQLIIDLSYLLDEFIAKLFNIEKEAEELKKKHNDFAAIYKCKRLFVQRYALKKYTDIADKDIDIDIDIDYVTSKLNRFLALPTTEKNFAEQVMRWLENKEDHKEEIELAAQYAA